jgi:hypothetical protein
MIQLRHVLQREAAPPFLTGYAVLIERADGSHTLECPRTDLQETVRQLDELRRFWGPAHSYTLAEVTAEQWESHRRPCRKACTW